MLYESAALCSLELLSRSAIAGIYVDRQGVLWGKTFCLQAAAWPACNPLCKKDESYIGMVKHCQFSYLGIWSIHATQIYDQNAIE